MDGKSGHLFLIEINSQISDSFVDICYNLLDSYYIIFERGET